MGDHQGILGTLNPGWCMWTWICGRYLTDESTNVKYYAFFLVGHRQPCEPVCRMPHIHTTIPFTRWLMGVCVCMRACVRAYVCVFVCFRPSVRPSQNQPDALITWHTPTYSAPNWSSFEICAAPTSLLPFLCGAANMKQSRKIGFITFKWWTQLCSFSDQQLAMACVKNLIMKNVWN